MNDRENLISLIRRRGYERMPITFGMTPDLDKRFRAHMKETGCKLPKQAFANVPDTMVLRPKTAAQCRAFYDHDFKPGTVFDQYGVANEPGSEACMHMTRMYHPLEKMETLEELQGFPYPKYRKGASMVQKLAVRRAHLEGRFAMGSMQMTIWETAWYMRGMEALMMDMMADEELADFLLDTVTENAVTRAVNFAQAGADGIYLGDDVGMQAAVMMSDELYCRFLKPRLKRVIDEARRVKPDILVFYHSCGFVTPFISHFIDAGVDVLNPVQPESMDFKEIHAQFHNKISFCGTIGTQTTMPFGKPDEIREEIRQRLDFVGKGGGLLICPTHVLEPEVPIDNIIAYIDACKAYRP